MAKLNEAILHHIMWTIALKGVRTRRCFKDRLNQLPIKLKMRTEQEEWKQPREVAKRLRKASKVGRTMEKEAQELRNQEREENIIRNIPPNRNKESARKEIAHRMRQKAQFQQIKVSVRGMRSGAISHITTPDPYNGYPYNPTEVRKWRDEHDTQKIEDMLLERNRDHSRQAARTPFIEEMLDAIPISADSECAEQVLLGEDIEGPTIEATQIHTTCIGK